MYPSGHNRERNMVYDFAYLSKLLVVVDIELKRGKDASLREILSLYY